MDKYLCERCGKELVFRCAYSRIDHKLICTECDDKEQPKELMKKIQELEAKLAESESKAKTYAKEIVFLDKKFKNLNKEFELAQEHNQKTIEYWQNEYSQLKQQLAEKDEIIKGLQEINQSLGQASKNDVKEIKRLREELSDKNFCKKFVDLYNENKRLSKNLKISWTKRMQFYNSLLKSKLKDVEDTLNKELFGGYYEKDISVGAVKVVISAVIDQQIKLLKGEK